MLEGQSAGLCAAATRWMAKLCRLACRHLGLPLALACTQGIAAENAEPRIAAVPGWVRTMDLAGIEMSPTASANAGVQYLLLDQQVRVTATTQSTYRHFAQRATNDGGLGSISHVDLSFNPAFQKLTLHFVNVHRGAQVSRRLARSAVKVLQRERDLEYRILDGTLTANLFLEDVRVGDVVEYAYTLEGTNPVFGDSRFGRFDLQWSVPIERLRYRLLWPSGRPLRLLARNGAEEVVAMSASGFDERVWDRIRVAGLSVESDAPGWYDPYPSVSWGDFDSWRAVVDWALPLYRVPASLSLELSAAARDIAQAQSDPQERIAAALRLVQSQVRYLGVEIGVNSHAPHPPDLVYSRRFGDCKDKALLLVALLRVLGVEASPALVNTGVRRGITEQLPSPGQFDHVIVHVKLDGQDFWLDPTRPTQQGRLANLYQPDYGSALVIRRDSQALMSMAGAGPRINKRDIAVVVDASAGPGQASSLLVRSVYQGLSADMVRADLASQPRQEVEKSYLNFYVGFYPGATMAAPLEVQDNAQSNQLTLVEHYSVPDLWRKPDDKSRMQATVYSAELKEHMRQTREPVRASPLQVTHPFEITMRTELRLPQEWQDKSSEVRIASDAFEYTGSAIWPERNRVVLTDTYRSLADHVAADRVSEHSERLSKAVNSLGYTVYLPKARAAPGSPWDNFNWTVALIGFFFVAILYRAALTVYRHDPPISASQGDAHLNGIGGWLLVAALVAIVLPLRMARNMWELLPAFSHQSWAVLTTVGGEAYSALWAPLLLFELFTQLALLLFATLMLILFFRKRSNLPRVWIGYCLFSLSVSLVDRYLTSLLPAVASAESAAPDSGSLVGLVIGSLAWVAYFTRSRRVRATFVRRLAQPLSDTGSTVALASTSTQAG